MRFLSDLWHDLPWVGRGVVIVAVLAVIAYAISVVVLVAGK